MDGKIFSPPAVGETYAGGVVQHRQRKGPLVRLLVNDRWLPWYPPGAGVMIPTGQVGVVQQCYPDGNVLVSDQGWAWNGPAETCQLATEPVPAPPASHWMKPPSPP